jgi:hypothetical protein
MLAKIAIGIGIFNLVLIAWFISRPIVQDRIESRRLEREAALATDNSDESHARVRYAQAAEYGRPQHIPAKRLAEQRAEWDRIGTLEPVEDALRGVPS